MFACRTSPDADHSLKQALFWRRGVHSYGERRRRCRLGAGRCGGEQDRADLVDQLPIVNLNLYRASLLSVILLSAPRSSDYRTASTAFKENRRRLEDHQSPLRSSNSCPTYLLCFNVGSTHRCSVSLREAARCLACSNLKGFLSTVPSRESEVAIQAGHRVSSVRRVTWSQNPCSGPKC